ncbi:hypothetical protein SYNPS1DRAFT_32047 [Syncephalis pseudoplumigaleata]|uniref:Uncharacterized protein n=1 Tax=Syncephalis pseudoplumigaleata TaxID=1712513 RepID=A0A4V1J0Q4_9FUNG|nr:hypothetical protein SYNPS1DRAFT_32047 [Syncephalis pseudoplumigaleata]|eukprot:RKP22369.1 hypothetical protein SYNPS1DRAFT_32047 [Syncephalis pseudoplumigaleata]
MSKSHPAPLSGGPSGDGDERRARSIRLKQSLSRRSALDDPNAMSPPPSQISPSTSRRSALDDMSTQASPRWPAHYSTAAPMDIDVSMSYASGANAASHGGYAHQQHQHQGHRSQASIGYVSSSSSPFSPEERRYSRPPSQMSIMATSTSTGHGHAAAGSVEESAGVVSRLTARMSPRQPPPPPIHAAASSSYRGMEIHSPPLPAKSPQRRLTSPGMAGNGHAYPALPPPPLLPSASMTSTAAAAAAAAATSTMASRTLKTVSEDAVVVHHEAHADSEDHGGLRGHSNGSNNVGSHYSTGSNSHNNPRPTSSRSMKSTRSMAAASPSTTATSNPLVTTATHSHSHSHSHSHPHYPHHAYSSPSSSSSSFTALQPPPLLPSISSSSLSPSLSTHTATTSNVADAHRMLRSPPMSSPASSASTSRLAYRKGRSLSTGHSIDLHYASRPPLLPLSATVSTQPPLPEDYAPLYPQQQQQQQQQHYYYHHSPRHSPRHQYQYHHSSAYAARGDEEAVAWRYRRPSAPAVSTSHTVHGPMTTAIEGRSGHYSHRHHSTSGSYASASYHYR